MKRRWLIASLATAALSVGLFGGTVLAQEATDDDDPESKSVLERAAEVLGIGEDELKDSLDQAREDIHEEHRNEHLDRLVEDGVLTEEEAADIREWLDARPDALDKVGPFDGLGLVPGWAGGEFGRRFGPHFNGPRVERDILPPGDAFREHFEALRDEFGFGAIDGDGFEFFWSSPPDDGEGGATDDATPTPTAGGVRS